MKGYVQVYTGNGKGKSTAAFGLCLRAVGAGLRVYIGQFLKNGSYNELSGLGRLGGLVTTRQFGAGGFIFGAPSAADRAVAEGGFRELSQAVAGGAFDLVIADELNVAVHYGLVSVSDVEMLIRDKPASVELVLTGRYAPQELLDAADLVTDMREVKHYAAQGVEAREGIER